MSGFVFAHRHSHNPMCSFTDRFLWTHYVPSCGPRAHYVYHPPARAQSGHPLCGAVLSWSTQDSRSKSQAGKGGMAASGLTGEDLAWILRWI